MTRLQVTSRETFIITRLQVISLTTPRAKRMPVATKKRRQYLLVSLLSWICILLVTMTLFDQTQGSTMVGEQQQQHESSTSTSTSHSAETLHHNNVLPWMGAWKFEETWFGEKHPWMPGFLRHKVLSSTLLLGSDYYHQVDHQGKSLKERRTLTLKGGSEQKAELVRVEGNKDVHFHLERRPDGHVYYVEHGLGDYRVLPTEWRFDKDDTQEGGVAEEM